MCMSQYRKKLSIHPSLLHTLVSALLCIVNELLSYLKFYVCCSQGSGSRLWNIKGYIVLKRKMVFGLKKLCFNYWNATVSFTLKKNFLFKLLKCRETPLKQRNSIFTKTVDLVKLWMKPTMHRMFHIFHLLWTSPPSNSFPVKPQNGSRAGRAGSRRMAET